MRCRWDIWIVEGERVDGVRCGAVDGRYKTVALKVRVHMAYGGIDMSLQTVEFG